jgi:hypothetical protein
MFLSHTFTSFVLDQAGPNRTLAHSLEHIWLRSSPLRCVYRSLITFEWLRWLWVFFRSILSTSNQSDYPLLYGMRFNPIDFSENQSFTLAMILAFLHPRPSEGSRMVIHSVRKRCWIFPHVFSLPVHRLDSDWCSIRLSRSLHFFYIVHELMARLTLQDFACLDLDMRYENLISIFIMIVVQTSQSLNPKFAEAR